MSVETAIKTENCKHEWDCYVVSTGYYSNDIEQAGICKLCGFDTHAHLEVEEYVKNKQSND